MISEERAIVREFVAGVIRAAALVVCLGLVLWVVACIAVRAQDGHRHPAQDMEAHRLFYWHLTRPDIPNSKPGSCCGDGDCYSTPARLRDGRWQAFRREDQVWIDIPESRVVTREDQLARRTSTQATLCATITFTYCFVPPEGGA